MAEKEILKRETLVSKKNGNYQTIVGKKIKYKPLWANKMEITRH